MATKTKKASGHSYTSYTHPFPPGTKVEVFNALDVEVERRDNATANAKAVAKGSVDKQGLLTVTGIKDKGSYSVGAQVHVEPINATDNTVNTSHPYDEWRYVNFQVS